MQKSSNPLHSKKKSSKNGSTKGQVYAANNSKVKTYQYKVRNGDESKPTTKAKLDQNIETDPSQSLGEQASTRQIQIDIDLTTTKDVRTSTESTLASKDSKTKQGAQKGNQIQENGEINRDSQNQQAAWHFGAYSQKSSSFMDYQPESEEPEYSQWSLDKVANCLKKSAIYMDQNKTPQKSNSGNKEYLASPQDHQKIGFGKSVISPKTPEQLQSSHCLKNSEIYKSKSIQASGSRMVTHFKSSAVREQFVPVEPQIEIKDYDPTLPLQIGQDVLNNLPYEVNSRLDLEGSQTSKVNLARQFEDQMDAYANSSEKEEDADEKQTTSSIFSNAHYCLKGKSPIREFQLEKPDEEEDDQIQAQALDFLDNMLDSGSDEEKEQEASKENLKAVKNQSVPSIFNSMSLFAFTGDGQSDNINKVFSTAFSANPPAPIQVPEISNGQNPSTLTPTQDEFAPMQQAFQMEQNPLQPGLAHTDSQGASSSNSNNFCLMNQAQCQNPRDDISTILAYLSPEDQQILCQLDFYCFDQAGCRMLQTKITASSEADTSQLNTTPFFKCLVHYMLPILGDVMSNQFGNYLCQKIIEMTDAESLSLIVSSVITQLVEISLNIHGTRAVQTLIDKLARNAIKDNANQSAAPSLNHLTLMSVISALNQEVVQLTMNMHGNHVIQAFLMIFKASEQPADTDYNGSDSTQQYTQFIFNACMSNCIDIGMHKHGCCVMQRCLEKGTRTQKLELANHIIQHMDFLIEDPYGNYLVQNVLKLEDEDKNEQIFKQIAKDFIRLSQLKFSSNVIEKCLNSKVKNCGPIKEQHIDKIFKGTFPQDDKQIIQELGLNTKKSKNLKARVHFIVQSLIYNQFGNYVLQKALVVIGDEFLRKEILLVIKSLSPSLMQVKHGQKVLVKLQKTYPKIFGGGCGQNFDTMSQGSGFSSNNYSQGSYHSKQSGQQRYQQKQFVPGQKYQQQYPFKPNTMAQNQMYQQHQNSQFNLNSAVFKPTGCDDYSKGSKENQSQWKEFVPGQYAQ